jgi:hypothetical protein
MSRHKLTPEEAALGGSRGGPKAGRRAVESGDLASYRTPEHQRIAATCSAHQRGSHSIPKLGCPRCFPTCTSDQ